MHLLRGEEVVGKGVEMAEPGAAEISKSLGLEAIVRNSSIFSKPIARSEVAVGNGVKRLPIEVPAHLAPRRGTEDRPAQVRLDQPGEVVVQRRDLAVGAGIGKIDRM